MPRSNRASVAFVLATLGMDALGVGIVAPIVPGLVEKLGHLPPNRAAPWVGALIAAYASMQFFAAPLLGALSDRFGRRPVILASVFGLGCDYVLLAVAPNMWWLFAGRLVAGATSANVAAATAYISDVTAKEDRPRLFGLIGATFGAGFVIGPALGGALGGFSLRLPFLVAAGLSFVNLCFGFFVLPESLQREQRRPFDLSRANPFTLLARVARDGALRRLAVAWSCTWIGLGAVQSSLVLFTGYSFHWGTRRNGLVLAVVGLSQAVVEGLLLRFVTGRVGERVTAVIGYAAGALGYGVLALAVAGWTVLPAVVLIALGGLATPSVRSMVAGRGDVDTQGEMQGVLAAVEGLTAVFAPLITAALFYAFTAHVLPVRFPGAPFALAGICAVVAGVLMRKK